MFLLPVDVDFDVVVRSLLSKIKVAHQKTEPTECVKGFGLQNTALVCIPFLSKKRSALLMFASWIAHRHANPRL